MDIPGRVGGATPPPARAQPQAATASLSGRLSDSGPAQGRPGPGLARGHCGVPAAGRHAAASAADPGHCDRGRAAREPEALRGPGPRARAARAGALSSEPERRARRWHWQARRGGPGLAASGRGRGRRARRAAAAAAETKVEEEKTGHWNRAFKFPPCHWPKWLASGGAQSLLLVCFKLCSAKILSHLG